ncbi:hypothetical protein MBLNU13_g04435t2 [Cladosporium sp. NU13]
MLPMTSASGMAQNIDSDANLDATMSVLKLNVCHNGDWQCITCCSDYNTIEDQPWQAKDESLVCKVCITRCFELGLENDYTWPPRFGSDILHLQDYKSIPPTELLDCITSRLVKEQPRIDPKEVAAAVAGHVRGRDFQVCPGCSNIITLKKGCNHISCVCSAQFCFICGQVAQHSGDHFRKESCPRWGQPTSEQAMFDRPDPVAEMREAHNNHMIQDFAQQHLAFHAGSWTWNVAMQTTADDGLRFLMGDLLRGNPEGLYRPPTDTEHAQVLNAMRAHNPLHRVSDERWERVVADSANTTKRQGGRVAAFMWMHDSVRAYQKSSYISMENVAVFDMGPTEEPRLFGAMLMAYLFLFGESATGDRFSFKRIAGNALLVELHPPVKIYGRPDALYSEAFWRQELLMKLWHRMANPDQKPVIRDAEWTRMWSEASRAWHEQTGTRIHAAL